MRQNYKIKTIFFNVNINIYLYKTVNYNVDKFIKLAPNKYGKNYWAYEAITTGNEWSSSIENLKKLCVLAINSSKNVGKDKVFPILYSRISELLENLVIDKSLTIDERLKSNACKKAFGYMNTLMIYTTLREKFILKYASTDYLDAPGTLFNKV